MIRTLLLKILDGYGLSDKDRYEIAEDIEERIFPLVRDEGERMAKAKLLAEMTEHGISLGTEK